jgi:ankyrin repeat protein
MGGECIVRLLLQNGARPDFEDEKGQTPLSRAKDARVVELLNSALHKGSF